MGVLLPKTVFNIFKRVCIGFESVISEAKQFYNLTKKRHDRRRQDLA